MVEFNPVQILHTGLIILDSNGVQREDTLYEIRKVCDELTSGNLSYIDVYDEQPVEEGYVNPIRIAKRFYNAADFLIEYGSKIKNTFNAQTYDLCSDVAITPEQGCTEIVPQVTTQAEIIPVEKNIVPNIPDCVPVALNPIYAPSMSHYNLLVGNFNQPPIAPADPANAVQAKKTYNAALMAEQLLKHVRLVNHNNGIYVYTGTHYKLLDKTELQKILYNVLFRDILDKGTFSYVEDIYRFVCIRAESLNFETSDIENRVMFSNCVLNLDTFQMERHGPHNFNMYALSVPLVSKSNSYMPVFSKYIYDLAGGNEVLMQRIWETLGLLLSNDIKSKRIVIFVGKGNTGKSVLGNVVRKLIADGNVTSFTPQKLTDRFIGAQLVNSAVNICMDLPSVPLDPAMVAMLKNLSGGDIVTGEIKYMNSFSYIYRGHLLFGSNYPIRINYMDQAFADRLLMIPCNNPIPKHLQDPNLLEKIKPELPAIATYAVMCFAKVRKNNYFFSGDNIYLVSAESIYTKASLNVTVNNEDDCSVEYFVKQMCEFTYDKNDFISTAELHKKYCEFCMKNSLQAEKMQIHSVGKFVKFFPTILKKTESVWEKMKM